MGLVITECNSNRLDLVGQLAEHWTNIPKVARLILRQTFQLSRCGCTLRVTSQTYEWLCFCLGGLYKENQSQSPMQTSCDAKKKIISEGELVFRLFPPIHVLKV